VERIQRSILRCDRRKLPLETFGWQSLTRHRCEFVDSTKRLVVASRRYTVCGYHFDIQKHRRFTNLHSSHGVERFRRFQSLQRSCERSDWRLQVGERLDRSHRRFETKAHKYTARAKRLGKRHPNRSFDSSDTQRSYNHQRVRCTSCGFGIEKTNHEIVERKWCAGLCHFR